MRARAAGSAPVRASRRARVGLAAALAALLAAGTPSLAAAADAEAVRRGMEALEAGRTVEARDSLAQAVAADAQDGHALLLLGIAELELGNPDAAVLRFRAARAADPSLEQLALYHEGVALAQADRRAEAREALARSIEADPHSRVARGARELLEAVDPGPTALRRFRLSSRAGIEFDDNVSVPEVDASSGECDGAFFAELAGSYRLIDSERTVLETGYDFSQTLHFELSDADVRAHGFWLDGTRALGAVDAGVGYRFGLTSLGGDGFLHLHEVRPRLVVPLRPGWTAEIAAGYLRKDFLDRADAGRDAHHASAGVENFFQLADRRIRANAGLRFEAEATRAAEFDYLGFSLGSGLDVPFEWRGEWALDLAWRLRLRDYSHETPSIGEARLDLENGVRVGLVRRITRQVETRLEYRLSAVRSNLPEADYVDNTVGLGVRVSL